MRFLFVLLSLVLLCCLTADDMALSAPPPVRLVPVHALRVTRGDLKSVRVSPDGRRAYVENLEGQRTLVYDTRTFARIAEITHVGKPVETAFTEGGRFVWISYLRLLLPGYPVAVPDETRYDRPSQVAVYDAAQSRIVARIDVGIMPKFLAVSPDESLVAVSNWISDTVTLIDTKRRAAVATVKVGHVPRGLCFTPDGRWLYVTNFRGSSLSRIDVVARRVVKTITKVGDQPRHLVITRDGTTMFLSTNRDGWLHKYSLTPNGEDVTETRVASVFVGREARTIGLTPDGRFVFVCCFDSGSVVAVDAATMKVVSRTRVGDGAVGLDLSPDGRHLWVVTQPTRTLRVFAVETSSR